MAIRIWPWTRRKPPVNESLAAKQAGATIISTAHRDRRYLERLDHLKENEALRQELAERRMALLVEHGNVDFKDPNSALIHGYLNGGIAELDWVIKNIVLKDWLPQREDKPVAISADSPKKSIRG